MTGALNAVAAEAAAKGRRAVGDHSDGFLFLPLGAVVATIASLAIPIALRSRQ